jgi:hypothetical protein
MLLQCEYEPEIGPQGLCASLHWLALHVWQSAQNYVCRTWNTCRVTLLPNEVPTRYGGSELTNPLLTELKGSIPMPRQPANGQDKGAVHSSPTPTTHLTTFQLIFIP